MQIIWPLRRVESIPTGAIVEMGTLPDSSIVLAIYTDPQGRGDFDCLWSMESVGVPAPVRRPGGGPRPTRNPPPPKSRGASGE